MNGDDLDRRLMTEALDLAARGRGLVEPNPMVGCVIARGGCVIGRGWHQRFGGPHAEPNALAACEQSPAGATLYVTLEPCCHHGKTPPCSEAIVRAGLARVVVAMRDPFPQVDGGGIEQIRAAGIQVEVGLMETRARELNAPYLKLVGSGRPWVIAKWAMTLDGRIATRDGSSRWISNPASRQVVHRLRGRVDAILVGNGTARADDPLLTARPAGPRTATRVVCDSRAALRDDSQLLRTARQVPVLVAVGSDAPRPDRERLQRAGCEVLVCPGRSHGERMLALLDELGRRRMTNLLVEGGSGVMGCLLDERQIDELHVFIAGKLVGGAGAPGPIGGCGLSDMADAYRLESFRTESLDGDLYVSGRLVYESSHETQGGQP